MFQFLFRCISCKNFPEPKTFPLCQTCSDGLVPATRLCSKCASPLCSETCLRPWCKREEIDSYSALYFLLGSSYRVLRRWKIQRGLFFNRQVLKTNPQILKQWQEFKPQAIVPIPQQYSRAWKMGGSPSLELSHWMSKNLGIPLWDVLLPSQPRPGQKRQAELSLMERLQSGIEFVISKPDLLTRSCPKNIILVDDFYTTGKTVSQAAKTLKRDGAEKIHVFCLGIRVAQKYF